MIDIRYLMIIIVFLLYYVLVLIFERKAIQNPGEIIEKFLAILLLYAGVSIIYFSLTGKPFLTDTLETYTIYIFIIGFIAVLWAIPSLLQEFSFFQNFLNKTKKKNAKK